MDAFHYYIETPQSAEPDRIAEHLVPIVFYASMDPVTKVRLVTQDKTEDPVPFTARPDVAERQKHLPFRHHISFKSGLTVREWLCGRESDLIEVQVFHGDTSFDRIQIPICKYRYREFKEKKFEKCVPLFGCPFCKGPVVREGKTFSCPACGKSYGFSGNSADFLTDELRAKFSIVDTSNVSDHPLEPFMLQAAQSSPDKLFLDVGAGFKYHCFENVVNLEIVDYPSTDVLGVGEQLPFLENSFDGVFSSVVLEHVKDPFSCARELTRVLKPGGELLCSAPFLQPRHGYPNHYYNMTSEGLANLFPELTIREATVPSYLQPMGAITWILGGYVQGLPQEIQQDFLSMRVVDIITKFSDLKGLDDPIISRLSQGARFGLACGTIIRAVKPERPGTIPDPGWARQ
jgi:SAM-dependent methyltransferase